MEATKVNNYEMIKMTMREFVDKCNKGLVTGDTAYQRELVTKWLTPKHRGAWLQSIMEGKDTGIITVNEVTGGIWELVNGKQRHNAIVLTVRGIGTFEEVEYDEALNSTFTSWSAELAEQFLDYELTFFVYKGLDQEACRQIFENLNNDMKMSSFELRRGKLVKIITNPSFIHMVELITPLMQKKSTKATKTGAEEVLLQALSNIALNNTDFTAKVYTEALQGSHDFTSALSILENNVNNVIDLLNEEDEDNFSSVKWILAKSILSCLLTLNVKEFNFLNFSSFPKAASDKQAGADQIEFKKYNSNGTASPTNVEGRINILRSIQSGNFTKNIAGERKEKTPAVPKTQKIQLIPIPPTKRQLMEACVIWKTEDEAFVKIALGNILAWCKVYGFEYASAFRTAKSGQLQYEYIDQKEAKHHWKPIADLSSEAVEVTVKIETATAEAVTVDA